MKLLYFVPKIKDAGGVARVLAIKANYFIENFDYEVHVLSQNEEDVLPFYNFHSKVVFHKMTLNGNAFRFFKAFKKQINQKINEVNPDTFLVADNGLKAFTIPFIVKTKIPIVFECHGSKFVEEQGRKFGLVSRLFRQLKYVFKNFGAAKFTKFVALSNESLKEWNVKNGIVIPNPSWVKTEKKAALKNKRVITVARNSYEKGLDRLLLIWKEIYQKHRDWTLDIYTDDISSLRKEASNLRIRSGVNYLKFVRNIEEKYLESSIYAMTSRTEGFPMVLLEAMASGLPCIAYDCPIGPRAIINNTENGFLIKDNKVEKYVKKLSFLIENEEVRLKFGDDAKQTAEKFSVEKVMKQWKQFLENL